MASTHNNMPTNFLIATKLPKIEEIILQHLVRQLPEQGPAAYALGTVATAAHSIANTAESAFYIPAYGIQTAAATLSGNAAGLRDGEYMKSIIRTLLILEPALMAVSGTGWRGRLSGCRN